METISPAAQDDSSGANPSSVKSDDSSPRHESGRGSPPPNCAICLGTCRNKSFTDSCLHQFCFKCLLTWSKVKAECPLCKQNFRSIIHNVRSNHQYEEYMVEQRHTEETTERIDIDNLTTTRRFRYRTTLTLPRRDTLAIQQLLMHYPMVADVFPPPAPAPTRPPPARRRRSPAAFRRTVYRHNLWARPLPDFTGRFRDCTPEFYRYNDTQMHRLVPWINRELHYLLNENVGHISYVMTRILELLPQYHISSPEFREAMLRYFGERTEHFLHELYCFASTPYDMTGYDRNVQYTTDTRISTMVNEVISSSESDASVDSDIVMVSSSEPAEPPPGPSRLPAPVYPQNYIPQPPADNVIPIETISQSDTDDDSSEVMVVGYIKPPQDRTPEVVDLLGSDSDVIVQDTTPPEPTQSEAQETQPAIPLVKLILKRHRSENRDSDSSEGTARPPPPRRKRLRRSSDTATTSDACRSTPSPYRAPSSSSSSYTTCPSLSKSSTSEYLTDTTTFTTTTTSSSSRSDERRKRKKKSKRKSRKENYSVEKDKKKPKKRSHKRGKRTSPKTDVEKDRRSKRKSHSGKGVKSSKKSSESAAAAPEQPPADLEQPGPSGAGAGTPRHRHQPGRERRRRRDSQESRRLRSVVNVMYSNKYANESSPSGSYNVVNNLSSCVNNPNSNSDSLPGDDASPSGRLQAVPPERIETSIVECTATQVAAGDDTDSEDNLPLNLTVQKTYFSL